MGNSNGSISNTFYRTFGIQYLFVNTGKRTKHEYAVQWYTEDNLSENLPVNAMADTVNVDITTQISIKWLVWLAGLCLCAGYFLIVYRKLYREFQMSFTVKIPQIEQWLVLHNGKRRIEIRQSDRVWPLFHTELYIRLYYFLKIQTGENMNVLQYVLEHEYVHIKRYDSITKLLVTAIVCIHWFNPMVWVMYILLIGI